MDIRHFIYLDTEKLYSISAQLFNGFTEEVISEKGNQESTDENQSIGFAKGKTLGHLYIEATKSIEKKFLHDQAFVTVEKHLETLEKVLVLDNTSINIDKSKFLRYPFVKIKVRVKFIDYGNLQALFAEFNDIGRSLTYLSHQKEFEALSEVKEQINKITDRNKKSIANAKLTEHPTLQELATKQGMNINEETLKHLKKVANFALKGELVFSQKLGSVKYNSYVNRSYLREPVELLLKKYQFTTHKELVVFGVVSQFEDELFETQEKADFTSFSDAISNLAEIKIGLDKTVSGISTNEVIIDPIAAYFE